MADEHRGIGLGALAATLVMLPATLAAQSQATTGVIRGTITDPNGQPVAAAQIAVRHVETGLERTLVTGSTGRYAAPLLPVGTYTVTAMSVNFLEPVSQAGIRVRLGESVTVDLSFRPIELAGITVVSGEAPLVDVTDVTSSTRISGEVLEGLPNNGRNYLELTKLTPGVGIVQGPDGDELSISGQRGIFNNISVDGADFNNPFFGEQRGGQRPAFTFNQDAIEEMVVVNQGATAEFGRSAGGFVNVITKSGTNDFEGTAHFFRQEDGLSSDFARGGGNPDFSQSQFGLTLGGPLVRDKAFFFLAYDQQEFEQTKQTNRSVVSQVNLNVLQSFLASRFGGTLANDFGPITRTNDAKALMIKLDWRLNDKHNLSLKYNYTTSDQQNGTFDVDTWGESANGLETDRSNAINGALNSQISATVANEFRFQFSREDRDRPYGGPTFTDSSGQTRPFPDTGADFADGFRWGLPFFLPILDFDDRFQVLNNTSILSGDHFIKFGGEWNRTRTKQTFIGFANGRYIFSSVDGFMNFVDQGPGYVECIGGPNAGASGVGVDCGDNFDDWGPLLLFLQFAPVQAGQSVEDAGTQEIVQNEIALFIQDTWTPNPNVTIDYGVRWEAQIQPDPITAPEDVFFAPFIGTAGFPSDGTIKSDYGMIQPRFGLAWDIDGDGRQLFRASAGIYSARIPGLVLASIRTANGSVGQNLFAASGFNDFGGTIPAYDELFSTSGGSSVSRPGINVMDQDFKNPRTYGASASYERLLNDDLAFSLNYNFAYTDNLFRFVNRNDAVFGTPFDNFPGDTSNGLGGVTVLESTAHSVYNAFTVGLKGALGENVDFEANYTLGFDKSDDDNERDPFQFKYARADNFDPEFNWSDRDQRHRFNAWILARLPGEVMLNNRISANSAQPISEKCGAGNAGTGERAASQGDRICPDGSILDRNTLRKDNAFFTWDVRASRRFGMGPSALEVIGEVFNLFNTDNFQDASAFSSLFNFDGTIRTGLGDPRRIQLGAKWIF